MDAGQILLITLIFLFVIGISIVVFINRTYIKNIVLPPEPSPPDSQPSPNPSPSDSEPSPYPSPSDSEPEPSPPPEPSFPPSIYEPETLIYFNMKDNSNNYIKLILFNEKYYLSLDKYINQDNYTFRLDNKSRLMDNSNNYLSLNINGNVNLTKDIPNEPIFYNNSNNTFSNVLGTKCLIDSNIFIQNIPFRTFKWTNNLQSCSKINYSNSMPIEMWYFLTVTTPDQYELSLRNTFNTSICNGTTRDYVNNLCKFYLDYFNRIRVIDSEGKYSYLDYVSDTNYPVNIVSSSEPTVNTFYYFDSNRRISNFSKTQVLKYGYVLITTGNGFLGAYLIDNFTQGSYFAMTINSGPIYPSILVT